MREHVCWAINLGYDDRPDALAGVLFFGGEPDGHLAGNRTCTFRTRREARDYAKKIHTHGARVVRVRVTIEEIGR